MRWWLSQYWAAMRSWYCGRPRRASGSVLRRGRWPALKAADIITLELTNEKNEKTVLSRSNGPLAGDRARRLRQPISRGQAAHRSAREAHLRRRGGEERRRAGGPRCRRRQGAARVAKNATGRHAPDLWSASGRRLHDDARRLRRTILGRGRGSFRTTSIARGRAGGPCVFELTAADAGWYSKPSTEGGFAKPPSRPRRQGRRRQGQAK